MASTVAGAPPRSSALRDPVLLLPLVVTAGLAIGWVGVHESVSGVRIAVDISLAWSLAAASLLVLERPRWRRTRLLLAASAVAVLGADLQWASSRVLWTIGFLLAGLWIGLLLQLVLTFPEGRPWSTLAGVTIIGAYAATFLGQLGISHAEPLVDTSGGCRRNLRSLVYEACGVWLDKSLATADWTRRSVPSKTNKKIIL
jgi:hypothetical protein